MEQGPRQGPRYNKKVAIIAKIYTDNQKYDRVSNSFNFKLTIFYNICKRSSLLLEGYIVAFPSMLKRLAQDHYYNSNLKSRPFTKTYNYIRQFFKGPEYYRKNLTEWNSMTLQGVIDKNPNKSIY